VSNFLPQRKKRWQIFLPLPGMQPIVWHLGCGSGLTGTAWCVQTCQAHAELEPCQERKAQREGKRNFPEEHKSLLLQQPNLTLWSFPATCSLVLKYSFENG
jgi:hypothetical protein